MRKQTNVALVSSRDSSIRKVEQVGRYNREKMNSERKKDKNRTREELDEDRQRYVREIETRKNDHVNRIRERFTNNYKRTKVITITKDDRQSYDILRMKTEIDIEKIGITDTRIRRTATGNLMIQIQGEGSKEKTDMLANEMRDVIGNAARVVRSTRKIELRVVGLDEDTESEEVRRAVVNEIGCNIEEVKVGTVRRNKFGVGSAWVQCPWNCATELVNKGVMLIGWVRARIMMLDSGPVQCFRCWGDMKVHSRSAIDRSRLYYRCRGEGHKAAECKEGVCCVLCTDRGLSSKHRTGSRDCNARRELGRVGEVDVNRENNMAWGNLERKRVI